uniref:Uncharacterized protein n=1 Tax=Arundo donax TaxID=35708 RepID=A0A0A9E9W3_ARUDO
MVESGSSGGSSWATAPAW